MIYEGAPSRQLPVLAAVTRDKLNQNFRCLYLNSPPMVAGMRSYLAAAGVDVEKALCDGHLQLSSVQNHLVDGLFNPDQMIHTLGEALHTALQDGYAGLCATGDLTWEMGPAQDFSKLLAYEWHLESFFRKHPQLSGICQYHSDTLPRALLRQGLVSHPAIFLNSTLARINPHYLPPEKWTQTSLGNPDLETALRQALC
ncbi:MAG: MEDS domain-containing protein [Acidobacteriaceae bacterium]|nr:MEDS domain-containing protein [Acidobacteriaceae bacterium]